MLCMPCRSSLPDGTCSRSHLPDGTCSAATEPIVSSRPAGGTHWHAQRALQQGTSMFTIEINNQQDRLAIDDGRLSRAVEMVLAGEGVEAAMINVAIVDDATIHDLNWRFLEHDEPTVVLSFLLDEEAGRLEGDIIASADTAARTAAQLQWPAADELLLYVVHGALHL